MKLYATTQLNKFWCFKLYTVAALLSTLPGGKVVHIFLTSCLNTDRVGKFPTSCLWPSAAYQMPASLLQSSLMMFLSHSGWVPHFYQFSYGPFFDFWYIGLWKSPGLHGLKYEWCSLLFCSVVGMFSCISQEIDYFGKIFSFWNDNLY